jgi:pimeloyl-ACP methyl ester carboxylesterase
VDTKNTSIVTNVHVSQVLSPTELSQIISSFGDDDDIGPEGNFCKGRHGCTHYILDRPPSSSSCNDSYGNLIVMAHGLGNSVSSYTDLSKYMTAIGYHVLRYDYFGHGYSKYGSDDMWVEYTMDLLIDQLEDVLDHVIQSSPPSLNLKISTFVGHSTGGLLGIAASARWSESSLVSTTNLRHLPRIVLLSPALWIAKVRSFSF